MRNEEAIIEFVTNSDGICPTTSTTPVAETVVALHTHLLVSRFEGKWKTHIEWISSTYSADNDRPSKVFLNNTTPSRKVKLFILPINSAITLSHCLVPRRQDSVQDFEL